MLVDGIRPWLLTAVVGDCRKPFVATHLPAQVTEAPSEIGMELTPPPRCEVSRTQDFTVAPRQRIVEILGYKPDPPTDCHF